MRDDRTSGASELAVRALELLEWVVNARPLPRSTTGSSGSSLSQYLSREDWMRHWMLVGWHIGGSRPAMAASLLSHIARVLADMHDYLTLVKSGGGGGGGGGNKEVDDDDNETLGADLFTGEDAAHARQLVRQEILRQQQSLDKTVHHCLECLNDDDDDDNDHDHDDNNNDNQTADQQLILFTISYSGTVNATLRSLCEQALGEGHNGRSRRRRIHVIISESRPLGEGYRTAEDLLTHISHHRGDNDDHDHDQDDIQVTVITEAQIGYWMRWYARRHPSTTRVRVLLGVDGIMCSQRGSTTPWQPASGEDGTSTDSHPPIPTPSTPPTPTPTPTADADTDGPWFVSNKIGSWTLVAFARRFQVPCLIVSDATKLLGAVHVDPLFLPISVAPGGRDHDHPNDHDPNDQPNDDEENPWQELLFDTAEAARHHHHHSTARKHQSANQQLYIRNIYFDRIPLEEFPPRSMWCSDMGSLPLTQDSLDRVWSETCRYLRVFELLR